MNPLGPGSFRTQSPALGRLWAVTASVRSHELRLILQGARTTHEQETAGNLLHADYHVDKSNVLEKREEGFLAPGL